MNSVKEMVKHMGILDEKLIKEQVNICGLLTLYLVRVFV
jgi:hypothetical protein